MTGDSSETAQQVVRFSTAASSLAVLHTALSALAFGTALVLGLHNHYHRIVKNQYYEYPYEWFPSVSATIGDWYPERNVFQVFIALTSGPRFLLVILYYILQRQSRSTTSWTPAILAGVSIARALSCAGWVYITSSDHGDVHDVFMVLYIVLNLPYMILHTSLSPPNSASKHLRRILSISFFASLVPLVYFYLRHKVHRVAGAYSIYALIEWSLIILDVSFDSVFIADFRELDQGSTLTPPISIELHSSRPSSAKNSSPSPPSNLELQFRKIRSATSSTRSFLADSYLSFLWWTVLTALGSMIFYSSVWSMGLSGLEVLLFSILSPGLLAIPQLRQLFSRPSFGNIGLLLGVTARWIPDEADGAGGHGSRRLTMSSIGLALATMGKVAEWWKVRNDYGKVQARSTTFLLGLVLSLIAKYSNHSLNPLWPFVRSTIEEKTNNGGWNNGLGLSIGILAYLQIATRTESTTSKTTPTIPKSLRPSFGSGVASTLGFGGLFFLLVLLYTDSGTTIAWSFEGYPTSGPFNVPHGALTIVALSLGILFPFVAPSSSNRLSTSTLSFLGACVCATLTYSQTSWKSFVPALLLGSYSTLLFPHYLNSLLSNTSTPASFFLAFFFYCLLVLGSTLASAYAFVPKGNAFRERMDLVVAATMILIGLGLYPLRSSTTHHLTTSRTLRRHVSISFLAIVFISVAISSWRYHVLFGRAVRPNHPENRIISAAIWTVHFGLDGKMWESQRRMASIVRDAEIDVIGLLESDVQRIVGGNRDITQYISETLAMPYVDLGPSPHKNTWGSALISKFPILRSSHHLLPSPVGELAPAIFATLEVYGTEVDVVVSHNGQEEDPLDRELQSKKLGELMAARWPNPAIFLGYVVTFPHAERPAPYKLLVEDGRMFDIDPTDRDRWCQYILYRGLHRIGYARLNRGSKPSITDTEIQLGKFVVPYREAPGSPWSIINRPSTKLNLPLSDEDEAKEIERSMSNEEEEKEEVGPVPLHWMASHLRLNPAPIPSHSSLSSSADSDNTVPVPSSFLPALRFPPKLSGEGVRGHFYISLDPHPEDQEPEQPQGKGPRYFLEKSVAEREHVKRANERKEKADEECKTM
ncbi:Cwh43p [Sporobolomyces salmoneus]|uniref:Cwh43p n=1 Tax=Sporobolomyces salmoneus TaxID=183962 RepID=UPI00316F91F6